MVSKPYVCENDETTKDTKAGEDKVDECVWVLGERKSVLGYQKPLVSLTLPKTGVVIFGDRVLLYVYTVVQSLYTCTVKIF